MNDLIKEPVKWFDEAVRTGKYPKDLIEAIRQCTSGDRFDAAQFMTWVSQQLQAAETKDGGD